jgi:hypothetical protein
VAGFVASPFRDFRRSLCRLVIEYPSWGVAALRGRSPIGGNARDWRRNPRRLAQRQTIVVSSLQDAPTPATVSWACKWVDLL